MAQAFSLPADRMSALRFRRDGWPQGHGKCPWTTITHAEVLANRPSARIHAAFYSP